MKQETKAEARNTINGKVCVRKNDISDIICITYIDNVKKKLMKYL